MKPLPKVVQWQVQKALPVSALPHPDADQLTAFTEQSLPRAERESVLEHLAQCSECRQVATLVEAPVPSQAIKMAGSRLWRPVVAWSGMAAGLLVVAAVLLSSLGSQHKELAEAMREQPSLAAQSPSGPITSLPAGARAAETAKDLGVTAGRSNLNASSNRVASSGRNSKQTSNTFQNQDAISDIARDTQPQGLQNIVAEKAVKDEPAHPAAGALSAKRLPAPRSAEAAKSSAIDMRESFAPSMPNTAIPTSAVEDRYPRWTLNSDGTLLRSLDTGARWQKIAIPGNAALLHSIATIGAEVWVGGASGALYHSTDEGGHWLQVTPASGGQLLSDDVISIEFASAELGKFVTSKQEVWTTADGGQTWSKK